MRPIVNVGPGTGRRGAFRQLLRRDRPGRATDTARAIAAGFPFDRFPDISITTTTDTLTVHGQVADDAEHDALLQALRRVAPDLRLDTAGVVVRRPPLRFASGAWDGTVEDDEERDPGP